MSGLSDVQYIDKKKDLRENGSDVRSSLAWGMIFALSEERHRLFSSGEWRNHFDKAAIDKAEL